MTGDAFTFRAKNGLLIELKLITSEDTPYLIDLFEHLSPQSRYQRFNQPLIDPNPKFIEKGAQTLATIEPPSEGWLAFADLPDQPHAPVGGGRFIIIEPGVAEVSLTVRDDLQGQGIGTEILRFLIREARKVGIDKLVAIAQATNRAVLNLLHQDQLPVHCITERGEMRIELDLRCCD